jgi:hypothetical protein
VKTLPFYKNYFNIAYPLPKIDLIAIADFSAGERLILHRFFVSTEFFFLPHILNISKFGKHGPILKEAGT